MGEEEGEGGGGAEEQAGRLEGEKGADSRHERRRPGIAAGPAGSERRHPSSNGSPLRAGMTPVGVGMVVQRRALSPPKCTAPALAHPPPSFPRRREPSARAAQPAWASPALQQQDRRHLSRNGSPLQAG